MRQKEIIDLYQYLFNMENRLEQAINDCDYRFVRRDLDSIDLLEEIIAKENLKFFKVVAGDILRVLHIYKDDLKNK